MRPADKSNGEHSRVAIIPGPQVQVLGEAVRVVVPQQKANQPAAAADEPQVELVREGDVVQAIEVTCSCGRKIRLRCVY